MIESDVCTYFCALYAIIDTTIKYDERLNIPLMNSIYSCIVLWRYFYHTFIMGVFDSS